MAASCGGRVQNNSAKKKKKCSIERAVLQNREPCLNEQTIKRGHPTLEEVIQREPIHWLQMEHLDNDFSFNPDEAAEKWIKEGPKYLNIENMKNFIDEELLKNILKKKSILGNLAEDRLAGAILRSNPFETFGKNIFHYAAAIKMANIDFAYDFMFTNPRYMNGCPMVKDKEILYFADVCAGPGGFSEYVLHKKHWHAKGIGFTLKGKDDFKFNELKTAHFETFETYYGETGDGNIFIPKNISSLSEFVLNVTHGKGVHFMMADGVFSVNGQENTDGLGMKQLYVCQFLVALNIVREEGHFVCKMYDVFSEYTAGLIYLMYKSFRKISIFKPNTSRPGSSERYIICKHKRRNCLSVQAYLFEIILIMYYGKFKPHEDVHEIVPLHLIKNDKQFVNYLKDSNNRLGNRQIVNLDKLIAFYQDPNLHERLDDKLRTRCMELWQVPAGPREPSNSIKDAMEAILQPILKQDYKPSSADSTVDVTGISLIPQNIDTFFLNAVLDWFCIPLGSDELGFLLGLGKNKVYRWTQGKWEYEPDLELSPGTLIYGEFVFEHWLDKWSQEQAEVKSFHIIDGISLGYEPISHYPYLQRVEILNSYTKALKKWNSSSSCPIRVKNPTPLKDIHSLFERFEDHCEYDTCLYDNDHHYYMKLKGMTFTRITKHPWRRLFSKTRQKYYYYDCRTRTSFKEEYQNLEAFADAISALKLLVLWRFQEGSGFKGELKKENIIHKDDIIRFREISADC